MTVFTSAEYGTVDDWLADGVIDFYADFAYVGPLVEVRTLVTLTCTEEVTGNGVCGNLSQGARHAERTAAHLHEALALITFYAYAVANVSQLATTIDTGQDMSACNLHVSVSINTACRA